jgi:hypothetical protein
VDVLPNVLPSGERLIVKTDLLSLWDDPPKSPLIRGTLNPIDEIRSPLIKGVRGIKFT